MTGSTSTTLAIIHALSSISPSPRGVLTVHTTCGISWDGNDILRFLGFCRWHEHPERPGHWCLIWAGAKSRGGKGKSPDKRGRKRGRPKNCYGTFYTKGKSVRAHKFFAVAILGLRPEPGQELDHECHVTLCVSDVRVLSKAANQERIRRRKVDRKATDAINHMNGSRKKGTRIKVLRSRMLRDAIRAAVPEVRRAVNRALREATSPQ